MKKTFVRKVFNKLKLKLQVDLNAWEKTVNSVDSSYHI